jgi:putative ABC transport system ATP-binding protein
LNLLRSLPAPGRRAVVMVTHDAAAAAFGDRVIHLRDGLVEAQQSVARDGSPLRPMPAPVAG